MTPRPSERGAALLSVLLMVAVLAVIAATTLDRIALSTKLSVNGNALAQARMFSYAAENIAVVIWNLLRPHLKPELDLALRLYETENNFVEFNGK